MQVLLPCAPASRSHLGEEGGAACSPEGFLQSTRGRNWVRKLLRKLLGQSGWEGKVGAERLGSEGTQCGGIKTSRDKSPLRTGSRSGLSLCHGVVCAAHGNSEKGHRSRLRPAGWQSQLSHLHRAAQPRNFSSLFPHLLIGVICFTHKVFYIYKLI